MLQSIDQKYNDLQGESKLARNSKQRSYGTALRNEINRTEPKYLPAAKSIETSGAGLEPLYLKYDAIMTQ